MARFMRKDNTRVFFLPTVVSKTAATVANFTSGTELTDEIGEMGGFTFTNNLIPTPDMGSSFVKKIPGEDDAEDSTMTFYEDKTTNPIRTALAKGVVGFIAIFPTGTAGASVAAADKYEIWPGQVASNAREYSAGNDPARYTVTWAVTDTPADGVVAA